jgi:glycosyltransferase involved in cell wall biosynthesis
MVIPRQDRVTGNWITAARLQQGLEARGHAVSVCETDGAPRPIAAAVAAFHPELVLLLHAWRSGRPWLESGAALPYAVLLTGTDVHAGMTDPAQAPVIETVLQRAAAILSQNHLTVVALRRARPALAARIHHLPAGVLLGSTPFPLRERLAAAPDELLLLCPAGIRPVKGVLELLSMCDPLAGEGRRLRLACCGPILEADYGRRFLEAVAARPWAAYLGSIPPEAMPAALCQADVIINNSSSEGLSNALAEAAALGRPIVARDIPGNAAVVVDGGNGLLYRDANGFRSAIRRLQDEPALAEALSHPDPERFAAERESATLEALCCQILGRTALSAASRNHHESTSLATR